MLNEIADRLDKNQNDEISDRKSKNVERISFFVQQNSASQRFPEQFQFAVKNVMRNRKANQETPSQSRANQESSNEQVKYQFL